MKTATLWVRWGLRVLDNTALSEAASRAERVIPMFILEEAFRTGPDVGAAPCSRFFSPLSQGLKCDLNGDSIRRWVPELDSLPEELIHWPWDDPVTARTLRYPRRIVIHEEQRPRCLAMFQAIKRIRD